VTDLKFVEQKPMEGREHSLAPGTTIGREGCDVVLADPEVSRNHATIRELDGAPAIEDLGSTNGTFVNDRRISGVEQLKDGDVVRLGNTVWLLKAEVAAAGATTVGQVQGAAGAPQVTAARAVPTDIRPPAPQPQATTAQAVPAAPPAPPQQAAAAVQQPAQPAAPSPQHVGRRGDVEQPPEVAPSAIRRVLPPPGPGGAPAFTPEPAGRGGGSAATRLEATVVCMLIVLAVAVGLAIYFISTA
jgi:predicted component of type VI protein secretion system